MNNTPKSQIYVIVVAASKDKVEFVLKIVRKMKNMLQANVNVSVEPSLITMDAKYALLTLK